MTQLKQTRKINLIPNDDIIVIPVSQYDTGEDRLVFELFKDGTPYSPSGTAKIQGTRPNGTFEHDMSIVGNILTCDLYADMTEDAGQVKANIVLTEGDDRTGSQLFFFSVQKDAEGTL